MQKIISFTIFTIKTNIKTTHHPNRLQPQRLWMMPSPPAKAMAMAMPSSPALTAGVFNFKFLAKQFLFFLTHGFPNILLSQALSPEIMNKTHHF